MPCRDMALYIKIYDLRMVSQIKKKVLLMKYWQPKYETMNPEEMKKLQLKRLQKSVKLVYDNVPFYRQNFKAAGVTPDDIKILDDVRKLPFTRKTDLRDNYPFGLFAAKKEDIVR